MPPFAYGGGMIKEFLKNGYQFSDFPRYFFAGTPNVSGVIGIGAAAKFIESIGVKNIQAHNESLKLLMEKKLGECDNVEILNPNISCSILLFKVRNVRSEDVAYELKTNNILLRNGYYCVKTDNEVLVSKERSVRVSFHIYNTEQDVEKFVQIVKEGGDFLGAFFKNGESEVCLR